MKFVLNDVKIAFLSIAYYRTLKIKRRYTLVLCSNVLTVTTSKERNENQFNVLRLYRDKNLYNGAGAVLRIVTEAVSSWLARSTPERALRVRALAGDIVLRSWARHFNLMVPLSTQVHKWVSANLMLGVTLR